MPVYTKTGDSGETNIGKERRPKDCPEAEVIGEIDELASLLGVVGAEMEDPKEVENIISVLMRLNSAEDLEKRIDEMWAETGELNRFILRFTDPLASEIHYTRAVCRRVERRLVAFAKDKKWIDKRALAYINRLSDYLFALARWVNKRKGGKEIEWLSDRT